MSASCDICDRIIASPAKWLLMNPYDPFSSFQLLIQKKNTSSLDTKRLNTKCEVNDSISPVYLAVRLHFYSVLLEHVQLRENRDAFQVHRRRPAEVEEPAATALGTHDLWVKRGKRGNQSENEGRDDEEESGVAFVDVLLAPGVLCVREERRGGKRGACCGCT